MSDPFEVLRTPVDAVAPSADFAARLRLRLERGLALPEGVTVSDLNVSDLTVSDVSGSDVSRELHDATGGEPASSSPAEDRIRQGDVAYMSLWVGDVARADTFFSAVLGWSYEPHDAGAAGRRVAGGHAGRHGLWGGAEHNTLMICYAVDDLADALERVRAAGGRAGEATPQPYGLVADCFDDEGTAFALWQIDEDRAGPRPAMNGTRPGDVSYITMEVRDSRRTREFYGAVLAWTFAPGRVEDGWGVVDAAPMTGLHGGHDAVTVVPMYRVDDIHAAVEGVRAAGGTATDAESQPYGLSAECVDDQGTRFYLGQL